MKVEDIRIPIVLEPDSLEEAGDMIAELVSQIEHLNERVNKQESQIENLVKVLDAQTKNVERLRLLISSHANGLTPDSVMGFTHVL